MLNLFSQNGKPLPVVKLYNAYGDGVHHDNHYKRPPVVECFVQRACQELPYGWAALPWTENRSVSIFRGRDFMFDVSYDQILETLVPTLDLTVTMAKGMEYG